jgi:hypothetical protein
VYANNLTIHFLCIKNEQRATYRRMWNVRSLYGAGSVVAVSKELSKYKLDLVGVQEVRCECGGTEPAGEYTFFSGNGNENHELGTGFLCTRESSLRGLSLLVVGCHTYTTIWWW